MTTQAALNLDNHKSLFRDELAYAEFVKVLHDVSGTNLLPIFAGQQLLGSIASPSGTREFLADRFLKRLSEKPELLAEIADRLENDEDVE